MNDSDFPAYAVVNVASGNETTVAELANLLRTLVAPDKEIEYQGLVRLGDPTNWRADINLLRSLIPDWSPKILEHSPAQSIAEWKII